MDKIEHFRHHLLFAFNRGVNAAEAAREICSVYGNGAIPESTARRWFSRFKNGNFDLKDGPHTGRPTVFDEERLNQLLHENPRQTTRELAEQMDCDQKTVVNHLRINCLVAPKQFVMDYAFPVPPYTQHSLSRMEVLFCSRSRFFVGAEPFFTLLHIDVQAPFFIASDDAVKKALLVTMC